MAFSVDQIWRYPVKSFTGEQIESTVISHYGIPFDRYWAVRDSETKDILSARQVGILMQFSARFLETPGEGRAIAEIGFPDGAAMATDDERLDTKLSDVLGRHVTLSQVRPETDDSYYKRDVAPEITPEILRADFGLQDDEPLSSFTPENAAESGYSDTWMAYRSRPGTHFDTSTLHILTHASLAHMRSLVPDAVVDVRRYRPNLLLSHGNDIEGPVEFDWVDQSLRIGETEMTVTCRTIRCIMSTREQRDLPRASKLMRALVRNTNQRLGVSAEVVTTGRISVGDSVVLFQ